MFSDYATISTLGLKSYYITILFKKFILSFNKNGFIRNFSEGQIKNEIYLLCFGSLKCFQIVWFAEKYNVLQVASYEFRYTSCK